MAEKPMHPLLEVKDLKTYFYTEDGVVKAVDGVDFEVYPGEVLGLVGESGCGKSVTSLSIMRLVGSPGKIVEGQIFYENKDLLKLSEAEMVNIRGDRISMIFQQPQSSLNPVFRWVIRLARSSRSMRRWQKINHGKRQLTCCSLSVSRTPVRKPVHTRMKCLADRHSA